MQTLSPLTTTRKRAGGGAFALILSCAFCFGLTRTTADYALPPTAHPVAPHIPPYHVHPPHGPLPRVLPWDQFANSASAENAYYFAAQIRPVLYQQPCYCPCGEELGHTCLLDCFTRPDKHAAICATCMQEAIFSYRQAMQGVDAQTIRAKIIKGEWKKVDLAKYNQPPAP